MPLSECSTVGLSEKKFGCMDLSEKKSLKGQLFTFFGGFCAVMCLFIIIPLIQLVNVEQPSKKNVFEESIVHMPRPAVHKKSSSSKKKKIKLEFRPPILEAEIPSLKISMLDVHLDPSLKINKEATLDSKFLDDLVFDIKNDSLIYSFGDLSKGPTIIYLPEIPYPGELKRKNILKGKVVVIILIDEKGFARCESIPFSSHPLLEKIVRQAVRKSRFSISRIDGKPVKVRGRWPMALQAS